MKAIIETLPVSKSATTTFEGKQLYLLTNKTTSFLTASNGNKFKVDLIDQLPVPVWADDKRSKAKLCKQAKINQKSRRSFYRSFYETQHGKAKNDNSLQNVPPSQESFELPLNNEDESDVGLDTKPSPLNKHNKQDVDAYSLDSKIFNILLIGISYNNFVRDQLVEDNDINHISMCVDLSGRPIEQSVARDTYRCFVLESSYPDVKVFTVNKCEDHMRICDNDTNPTNVNSNVGSSQFISLLNKKNGISMRYIWTPSVCKKHMLLIILVSILSEIWLE